MLWWSKTININHDLLSYISKILFPRQRINIMRLCISLSKPCEIRYGYYLLSLIFGKNPYFGWKWLSYLSHKWMTMYPLMICAYKVSNLTGFHSGTALDSYSRLWRGPFTLGRGGLAANMPTVGVKRDLLFKALGRTYSKSYSLHIQETDKLSALLSNIILALKDRGRQYTSWTH